MLCSYNVISGSLPLVPFQSILQIQFQGIEKALGACTSSGDTNIFNTTQNFDQSYIQSNLTEEL